jgi:hypothetical protein
VGVLNRGSGKSVERWGEEEAENQVYFNGSLIIAAAFGMITQSWVGDLFPGPDWHARPERRLQEHQVTVA